MSAVKKSIRRDGCIPFKVPQCFNFTLIGTQSSVRRPRIKSARNIKCHPLKNQSAAAEAHPSKKNTLPASSLILG